MRTLRLLLVPVALTTVLSAPPAHAAGACVAVYPGATYVECPGVLCLARSTVRVQVAGTAAGVAHCGSADAYCRASTLPLCTGTERTTSSGTMACSVDPLGTQPIAVAVCDTVPSAA